jgi:ACS family D-galactonate transporter-like MFS transporter
VLWGTVIGTFCYMYFVYFCLTWMPAYFNEARHLSLASSSLFTTFSFAGMATVSILGGWAADRLIVRGHGAAKVRKAFTIAGFLLATTVLIGAGASSLNTALFFSVLSLSGLGLATANYWALTQTLIPGGAIGRIVGIQNCAASVAGIVAPILTGWLVDTTHSFDAPIKAVAFFIVLGWRPIWSSSVKSTRCRRSRACVTFSRDLASPPAFWAPASPRTRRPKPACSMRAAIRTAHPRASTPFDSTTAPAP